MSKDVLNVPEGWNNFTLKELIVSHNSGIYKKKDEYGEGSNIVGVSDIYNSLFINGKECKKVPLNDEEIQKHTLQENDLLYGESSLVRSGIARTVCVTKEGEGTTFAWHTRRLRINQQIAHSPYLVNLLADSSIRVKVESVATQTALTGMTTTDYFSITLPIPPLPEQQKIASILTSVDDVIEKTEAQISKLQDLKKGMMTELLTKGIGHTEFKDSPVGRIPKSWEFKTLKDVTKLIKPGPFGSSIKKSMYVESGFKVYGQEQVISGDITVGDYYITEDKYKELSAFRVKSKDVLVSLVGTFGHILVVPELFQEGIINPRLLILRFDEHLVDSQFIKFQLISDHVSNQLRIFQQGGTMGVLSAGTVKPVTITVPPLAEQKEIASIFTSIDSSIMSKQQKFSQTKALKKALMNDLLTGKKRVVINN